jgi:hypothetical protein
VTTALSKGTGIFPHSQHKDWDIYDIILYPLSWSFSYHFNALPRLLPILNLWHPRCCFLCLQGWQYANRSENSGSKNRTLTSVGRRQKISPYSIVSQSSWGLYKRIVHKSCNDIVLSILRIQLIISKYISCELTIMPPVIRNLTHWLVGHSDMFIFRLTFKHMLRLKK